MDIFQNIVDDHVLYDNMDELERNISRNSRLDQMFDEKCGLNQSNETDNTYMSCSFWMEGVLLFGTGTKR